MQDQFRESAEPECFRGKLAGALAILRDLRDPRCGFSGETLIRLLNDSDVSFAPAPTDQGAIAAYRPFDRTLEQSFIHRITCHTSTKGDKPVPRSAVDIAGSLFHEISHAFSWDFAPALHASPYNRNTPVILCPEDFALMTNLTERVAYANVGWLMALAQKDHPELGHIVTPVNGPIFDFLLKREGGDIGRALAAAGDLSMLLTWGGGKDSTDGTAMTMEQYYQQQALRQYEWMIDTMIKNRIEIPLVVRLEPHNLAPVGRSFGPNIVEVGQTVGALRPQDEAWVQRIHKKMFDAVRVPDYAHLPTFSEGLARYGYNEGSYLNMSRTAGTAKDVVVQPHVAPVRRSVANMGLSNLLPGLTGAMVPA